MGEEDAILLWGVQGWHGTEEVDDVLSIIAGTSISFGGRAAELAWYGGSGCPVNNSLYKY